MKIKIYDIEIQYEVLGQGIPLLVIPGLFINSKSMMPVIEPIFFNNKKYKRIYIDMPGMGDTPRHSLENTTESMIKILMAFIEKVVDKEKLYLVGYSYGGYLATGLGRHIGDQILGEVRICAVVHPKMKDRTLPLHEVKEKDDNFLHGLTEEEQKEALENLTIINEKTFSRYKDEITKERKRSDRKFLLDLFFNGYTYDLIEGNKEWIRWPVLFILGRQDAICGYKDTWSILDFYENATVHLLNKASHNLYIEQENLFNHLVKSWFDEN